MTMTTTNDDLKALRMKLFELSDDLDTIYRSYDALQVIATGDAGDSRHVGLVLCGLNYRLEGLLVDLSNLRKTG
jgi:hypothetical protein